MAGSRCNIRLYLLEDVEENCVVHVRWSWQAGVEAIKGPTVRFVDMTPVWPKQVHGAVYDRVWLHMVHYDVIDFAEIGPVELVGWDPSAETRVQKATIQQTVFA
jgi:hypothetical protein